ncbi:hypothetical protein CDAR_96491 [Caerostris darwini]|uniref:Uncharacterized protein n=1 Tax=Caerostris darwini TaxID=1538125 RepID=A0AAV4QW31_9ARAC|nr:hypothetical protein CDAR_96491 [Caerostris darwini]
MRRLCTIRIAGGAVSFGGCSFRIHSFRKAFLSKAWRQGKIHLEFPYLTRSVSFIGGGGSRSSDVSFDFIRKEHVHEWVRVWFSLKESIGIIQYCVLVANRFWMLKNSCRI